MLETDERFLEVLNNAFAYMNAMARPYHKVVLFSDQMTIQ